MQSKYSSRTPSKVVKSNFEFKSRTPSRQPINSPKPLNTSITFTKNSTLRDHSQEPLRMAIKLEDILKSGAQQLKPSTLKPELIEPEIESSIPCIDYAPKSVQNISSNIKNLKCLEKFGSGELSPPSPSFRDFSLEKMNDECQKFEKNILGTGNQHIGEITKFLSEKFNCKVKLKPESKPQGLPSVVLVKKGSTYELFNVIKY